MHTQAQTPALKQTQTRPHTRTLARKRMHARPFIRTHTDPHAHTLTHTYAHAHTRVQVWVGETRDALEGRRYHELASPYRQVR